jgi:hypothetical protein
MHNLIFMKIPKHITNIHNFKASSTNIEAKKLQQSSNLKNISAANMRIWYTSSNTKKQKLLSLMRQLKHIDNISQEKLTSLLKLSQKQIQCMNRLNSSQRACVYKNIDIFKFFDDLQMKETAEAMMTSGGVMAKWLDKPENMALWVQLNDGQMYHTVNARNSYSPIAKWLNKPENMALWLQLDDKQMYYTANAINSDDPIAEWLAQPENMALWLQLDNLQMCHTADAININSQIINAWMHTHENTWKQIVASKSALKLGVTYDLITQGGDAAHFINYHTQAWIDLLDSNLENTQIALKYAPHLVLDNVDAWVNKDVTEMAAELRTNLGEDRWMQILEDEEGYALNGEQGIHNRAVEQQVRVTLDYICTKITPRPPYEAQKSVKNVVKLLEQHVATLKNRHAKLQEIAKRQELSPQQKIEEKDLETLLTKMQEEQHLERATLFLTSHYFTNSTPLYTQRLSIAQVLMLTLDTHEAQYNQNIHWWHQGSDETTIQHRKEGHLTNLLERLYVAQRANNIDENGKDTEGEDDFSCIDGGANRIIETIRLLVRAPEVMPDAVVYTKELPNAITQVLNNIAQAKIDMQQGLNISQDMQHIIEGIEADKAHIVNAADDVTIHPALFAKISPQIRLLMGKQFIACNHPDNAALEEDLWNNHINKEPPAKLTEEEIAEEDTTFKGMILPYVGVSENFMRCFI